MLKDSAIKCPLQYSSIINIKNKIKIVNKNNKNKLIKVKYYIILNIRLDDINENIDYYYTANR